MSIPTLIDELLEEQQDLTAVERFAQQQADGGTPLQQRYYSSLIPATPPGHDEQFAFHVDLEKCSGCKACVTACHNMNGLDEEEAWRDVGLLVGGTPELPVLQHVTTACHHCLEPACAEACPVDAYEKNPITGIVKHLDDQCFGCQYCTLACPYDVPKYNASKGIVRKCDMCSDRLNNGEAPACVQSCPHEAISIQTIKVAEFNEVADADRVVPTSPLSDFTKPTTVYSGGREYDTEMMSAAEHAIEPEHAHWPLIWMLVLTQMSVGMYFVGIATNLANANAPIFNLLNSSVALLVGLLGLVASTCHLGRPQFAFRALIGLSHSWLSREIAVFGLFAGAAIITTGLDWFGHLPQKWRHVSAATTVISGLAGVYCSAKIYAFTRREFWRLKPTLVRFMTTAVILGGLSTLSCIGVLSILQKLTWSVETYRLTVESTSMLVIATSVMKLCVEYSIFRFRGECQMRRSAKLLATSLKNFNVARFAFGIGGGILMPLIVLLVDLSQSPLITGMLIVVAALLCIVGEILERYLFFAAVSPDRMPGGLRL